MAREVPVQSTWSAGILSTGTLNREIRDTLSYLLTPPLTVVRKLENDQVIGGNFNRRWGVLLEWDTVEVDSDGAWDSQNHRYVAQVAGFYEFVLQTQWIAEQGTGLFSGRYVFMTLNNTNKFGGGWWLRPAQSSYSQSKVMTAMIQLDVGDYVDIQCYARSGDSTIVGYDGTSHFGSEWVIRWISKP